MLSLDLIIYHCVNQTANGYVIGNKTTVQIAFTIIIIIYQYNYKQL